MPNKCMKPSNALKPGTGGNSLDQSYNEYKIKCIMINQPFVSVLVPLISNQMFKINGLYTLAAADY